MNIQSLKSHIGFLIDISVLSLFVINIKLLSSPLWMALILSNLLSKDKKSLNKKIDTTTLFILIGFLFVFISLIFTGGMEYIGKIMAENILWVRIALIFLIILVTVLHVRRSVGRGTGSERNGVSQ